MFSLLRKLLGIDQEARIPAPASHDPGVDAIDFKGLAEHSNDVIFRVGSDGKAIYVSPSSTRVFGWTPDEMIGKGPNSFVLPEDLPLIAAADLRHKAGQEGGLLAFRIRRKDGTALWVEGSARVADRIGSEMPELVVVMRDITERKALEGKLEAMALTDGLTGLANRRAFDRALDNEWRSTKRNGTQISLLLLDMDHFKQFNDQYGHQVGDDCLRMVSTAIRDAIGRPDGLVARYGGEEIVAILPDVESSGAVNIAEAVRSAVIALRIPHAGNKAGPGVVTVSIGAATAVSGAGGSVQMPAGLLQAADMALYKAKHLGRNRVETALLLTEDGPAADAA